MNQNPHCLNDLLRNLPNQYKSDWDLWNYRDTTSWSRTSITASVHFHMLRHLLTQEEKKMVRVILNLDFHVFEDIEEFQLWSP